LSTSLASLTGASSTTSSSSGMDVGAIVDQLMYVERAPERLMQAQQTTLTQQSNVLKSLQTNITSMQTAADALKDVSGAFSRISAQSGDTAVFRATATSEAGAGTHTVVVTRLASTSSFHSKVMQPTDKIAAGSSVDLAVGSGKAVKITFDSDHTTLAAAAQLINASNAGVTASVVNGANGAQLALVSQTGGAAGAISIANDTTGLQMQEGNQGLNAQVSVDGIPVESATNTVDGALPGVTLNLVSAAPGRAIVFSLGKDTSAASSAVQNYVSAYNDAIKAINSQFTYNAISKSSGVLAGDATVRAVQQQLLTLATQTVDGTGGISSLAQLGVTMNNDGTLTVDSGKLNTALTGSFDQVQAFFQQDKTGFAVLASAALDAIGAPTSGAIAADLKGIDADSRSVSDSIDEFEVRMTARQKQLTDEYTRIDVMMRQFSALQNQVSTQLASLTKNNS
jgi:flagellar hook-associated protein 2